MEINHLKQHPQSLEAYSFSIAPRVMATLMYIGAIGVLVKLPSHLFFVFHWFFACKYPVSFPNKVQLHSNFSLACTAPCKQSMRVCVQPCLPIESLVLKLQM